MNMSKFYEVSKVLDKRTDVHGLFQYLVRWRGYNWVFKQHEIRFCFLILLITIQSSQQFTDISSIIDSGSKLIYGSSSLQVAIGRFPRSGFCFIAAPAYSKKMLITSITFQFLI